MTKAKENKTNPGLRNRLLAPARTRPTTILGCLLFLLLGLPTLLSADPTSIEIVDIVDGWVDVNQDGAIDALDNTSDVLVFFDDAAAKRVDIIDGFVDVFEQGYIDSRADLPNLDLNVDFARNQVDIIDGMIDVNEDGEITDEDDLGDVRLLRLLTGGNKKLATIYLGKIDTNQDFIVNSSDDCWCLLAFNDATLFMANIVDGLVDVDLSGTVDGSDDLINVDLTQMINTSYFVNNQVDIIDGYIDVNEDSVINWGDGNPNWGISSFSILDIGATVEEVDIIQGRFDVNQDGFINSEDFLDDVILLFDDAAPIRVDIIRGHVDVNESGSTSTSDVLRSVDLNVVGERDAVDIIAQPDFPIRKYRGGWVDVNRDGVIDSADSLTDVSLVVPSFSF